MQQLYTYTYIHAEYILTQWIKTSKDFFRKISTSHFIVRVRKGLLKVLLWEGVGDWTRTATYWPPQSLRTSPCVVLVRLAAQPGAWGPGLSGTCSHFSIFSRTCLQIRWGSRGPLLPGGGFLYHIPSPTSLHSNSLTSCSHRVI